MWRYEILGRGVKEKGKEKREGQKEWSGKESVNNEGVSEKDLYIRVISFLAL